MYLFPLLVAGIWIATREVLELADAGGIRPVRWTVYLVNVLLISAAWASPLYSRLAAEGPETPAVFRQIAHHARSDWVLVVLAVGVGLIFLAESTAFRAARRCDGECGGGRLRGRLPGNARDVSDPDPHVVGHRRGSIRHPRDEDGGHRSLHGGPPDRPEQDGPGDQSRQDHRGCGGCPGVFSGRLGRDLSLFGAGHESGRHGPRLGWGGGRLA